MPSDPTEGGQAEPDVKVEKLWRCTGNGQLYMSPRCGFGAEHEAVTVTTTSIVTVEEADGH